MCLTVTPMRLSDSRAIIWPTGSIFTCWSFTRVSKTSCRVPVPSSIYGAESRKLPFSTRTLSRSVGTLADALMKVSAVSLSLIFIMNFVFGALATSAANASPTSMANC